MLNKWFWRKGREGRREGEGDQISRLPGEGRDMSVNELLNE